MKLKALFAITAMALLLSVPLFADKKDENKLKGIKCPVSGKPVKAASSVPYKGGKVYFCCNNCPKAFKKNTAKFAAKANHQLVATGQAKEVKCPLTGRKLNTATVIDVAGAKVCFCCGNCKKKAQGSKDAIQLIFNDKAFAKGFKVAKKKDK